MRRLLVFLTILCPSLVAAQWQGKVVNVVSGDQYQVKKPSGKTVEVRLYGIACPGNGQPYENEATIAVANKLVNRRVKVKKVETGLYDRVIAKVFHKSIMINQWLLRKGLAWVFTKYCKKAFCDRWKAIQERKKASRTGLWSQKNPKPPWE